MGIEQMVYWNIDRWDKHYSYLVAALPKAIEQHETYCMDPECKYTNWGGVDRLHTRDDNDCPKFVPLTRTNYQKRLIHAEAWAEKYNECVVAQQNAEDDAKINYYADKILEALNA